MRHPDQSQLARVVADFEAGVLAQQPVAYEHYDEDYGSSRPLTRRTSNTCVKRSMTSSCRSGS